MKSRSESLVVMSDVFGISWFNKFFVRLKPIQRFDDAAKELVRECDLLIFPGGSDINPEIYGEINTGLSSTKLDRDEKEVEIFDYAIKHDKPILGICRGHQLINALFGGILIQDLGERWTGYHPTRHNLDFIKNGSLAEYFKDKTIASTHHQGVIKAGSGLIITSDYREIIESTEHEKYKIITFQGHPEYDSNYKLFDNIIEWSQK